MEQVVPLGQEQLEGAVVHLHLLLAQEEQAELVFLLLAPMLQAGLAVVGEVLAVLVPSVNTVAEAV